MASGFFSRLTGGAPKEILGIDIGTTSIKIVEARRGTRGPEITNYGILEAGDYLGRANSALQTSALQLFERETVDLLRLTLQKMKVRATRAIFSIPIFSYFYTVIDLPHMTEAEIGKNIEHQARQYVPFPSAELFVEWVRLDEYEDERGFAHTPVFFMAIPKEHVQKYRAISEALGLELRALEMESMSVARSLIGTDTSPALIIDIGSRSTAITFIRKGKIAFAAQSDFAGASLTQAIASSLNINPRRAEEIKQEKGIAGGGVDYELSTLMMPFLDVIMNEVKKARGAYERQFPFSSKLERVILTGGGASLKGIESYAKRELELPVGIAAPFSRYSYKPELEPVVRELNPRFGVALGLALQELH